MPLQASYPKLYSDMLSQSDRARRRVWAVGNIAGGVNICEYLTQVPTAARFLPSLCGGGLLNQLRQNEVVYRGSGDPLVNNSAKVKGTNESEMSLWTSMRVPTTPVTYFNMMQLQSRKPDDFDNMGYESVESIDYTVMSDQGNRVQYQYENTKSPEAVIKYIATTKFHVLVPGALYVVATDADEGIITLLQFNGIVIINKPADGQGAEIFSLADQTYTNNNKHQKTVDNAKQEFQQEMARSFRNSAKAQSQAQQLSSIFP